VKALLFVGCAVSLLAQNAQQPSVSNGRFESRPFSGDLNTALRASEPTWFGYAIKTMRGDHDSCCYDDHYNGCFLEDKNDGHRYSSARPSTPIPLEGSDLVEVLFRVENNAVEKVRVFSLACPLDAGSLRFVWLTSVPAKTSLTYLETLAQSNRATHVMDGAVLAISLHDTPQADEALDRLTRPSMPVELREKATFWLGANRGSRGVTILKNILAHDPSDRIREKAVFALSISKDPEATQTLIGTAQHDPTPHVRSQALFWLAQKAGARSVATIQNAIENDPDTEVRKKAVFAMSQLPKDEGVPRLIEIAKTQRNPEVRKQAFFWLGQSNDPRALAFFEQVLAR
jgi:HEAT repeat protein